ncbi:MAG: hypothetical protein M0R80_05145 [Proteobacteria bacterium]|jgi:hypothetical protein|nr:hypothetical protein [Pseudomonadota bacterium]
MTRLSMPLLAAILVAWTSSAAAQEIVPPSPEAPAPKFLWGASDGASDSLTYDCDLTIRSGQYACPRDVQRRWRRHQNELRLLDEVIAEEGPEYSERKYRRYVGRIVWGAVFVAVGAAGFVYGIAYGMSVFFSDFGDHDDGEGDANEDNDLGPKGTGLGTFFGGLASIAIGVPILISGFRGKKRQKVLRRADEIRAPFDPFEITATLHVDPRTGSAALALSAAF